RSHEALVPERALRRRRDPPAGRPELEEVLRGARGGDGLFRPGAPCSDLTLVPARQPRSRARKATTETQRHGDGTESFFPLVTGCPHLERPKLLRETQRRGSHISADERATPRRHPARRPEGR